MIANRISSCLLALLLAACSGGEAPAEVSDVVSADSLPASSAPSASSVQPAPTEEPAKIDVFLGGQESLPLTGDERMDDLIYWAMTYIWSGSADIGEILSTARRLKAGDATSWYDEWMRTAERVRAQGQESLDEGHEVSAGQAFLRASRYYRTALSYYADADDPRLLVAARSSVQTFKQAMALLPYDMTNVEIPYEGTSFPGYFFRSPYAVSPAPILIIQSGWDSWPEDEKHLLDGALMRGYHCLLIHAPGQGMALRERKLSFRPDWEAVIGPVVDFVSAQPGVDPERIALMGISFGGFLVPRAAAKEPRIKACIMNPGAFDFSAIAFRLLPPDLVAAAEKGTPEAFDAYAEEAMRTNPHLKPLLEHGMNVLGATKPSEFVARMRQLTLEGLTDQIKCKALVFDGTRDFFGDQSKKLADALRTEKEYVLFDDEVGGTLHCRQGAIALLTQRTFDWLDDQFEPQRKLPGKPCRRAASSRNSRPLFLARHCLAVQRCARKGTISWRTMC